MIINQADIWAAWGGVQLWHRENAEAARQGRKVKHSANAVAPGGFVETVARLEGRWPEGSGETFWHAPKR